MIIFMIIRRQLVENTKNTRENEKETLFQCVNSIEICWKY